MSKGSPQLRYLPLAIGIGAFFVLSYLACSIWDGLVPSQAMHSAWVPYFPGFSWWSWGSFFLGLVEAFAWGFWFALILPIGRWALRIAGECPADSGIR